MGDFAPHNMSDYDSPAPYVVSDSTHLTNYYGWRCFNDEGSSPWSWLSLTPAAEWVKLDLGPFVTHTLNNYSIKGYPSPSIDRSPKDWIIYGSNNDSDWDTLDTVTGETEWASSELRNFLCDTITTPYRYFRLSISANNGGTYIGIQELYLFEIPLYYLSGTVKEKGIPVERVVRSYIRSTGALYGSVTSNPDGSFSLPAPDEETEMYVIALDNDPGLIYNALIYDRVYGVSA